jgi:hypothetical protein
MNLAQRVIGRRETTFVLGHHSMDTLTSHDRRLRLGNIHDHRNPQQRFARGRRDPVQLPVRPEFGVCRLRASSGVD